jgi:hypothetical protein
MRNLSRSLYHYKISLVRRTYENGFLGRVYQSLGKGENFCANIFRPSNVASDHDFQNATVMNQGIDIEQDIDVYEMTITMTLNF